MFPSEIWINTKEVRMTSKEGVAIIQIISSSSFLVTNRVKIKFKESLNKDVKEFCFGGKPQNLHSQSLGCSK